jgi:membrane-associated protease RseP (regulator of RpoE activity)
LLQDKRKHVRKHALEGLNDAGPEAAGLVPVLKGLLREKGAEMRSAALALLQRIVPNDPDVVQHEAALSEAVEESGKESRPLTIAWSWLVPILLVSIVVPYRGGGRLPDLVIFYWSLMLLITAYHGLQTLVARAIGLAVQKVEIGVGPCLARGRLRGVEWTIAVLPVFGDVDWYKPYDPAAEDPDEPVRMWWKVLLDGAALPAYFIVGFMALVLSWWIGRTDAKFLNQPPLIGWCRPGSALEGGGLRPGDEIVSVELADRTVPTPTWRELLHLFSRVKGPATLQCRRGSESLPLEVDLDQPPIFDLCHDVPPLIAGVESGSPGQTIGLKAGDRVIAVDGKPVAHWLDMKLAVFGPTGTPPASHSLTVDRGGNKLTLEAPAALLGKGALGVRWRVERGESVRRNLGDAFDQAWVECWEIIRYLSFRRTGRRTMGRSKQPSAL